MSEAMSEHVFLEDNILFLENIPDMAPGMTLWISVLVLTPGAP